MSKTPVQPDRRMMLVHAHPDDESSQTALAMAKYVDEGAQVTLVTATLGELGEIVSEPLKHLSPAELGPHRLGELTQAMAALRITDFVRLGGDGHYHDSGMAYAEDGSVIAAPDMPEGAFASADLREAADFLVELIRDRRPQVLITYDDFGGYGHPDHVQAHRVTMYAQLLAAVPGYRPDLGEPWQVSRVFWSAWAHSSIRAMIRAFRAGGDEEAFGGIDPEAEQLPMGVPDELISVWIDAPQYSERQRQALAAHVSQVNMDEGFFARAMSGAAESDRFWQRESYRLATGRPLPGTGPADDLFAGID